jgi:hypothetical protein
MKTLAVLTVVAAIAIGAVYAKREAVASFEHAVATQAQRSNV